MSQNIEIKAELSEQQFRDTVTKAKSVAGELVEELYQKDTFFLVPQNRLKLRQFPDGSAELIAYSRSDSVDPIASNYFRTPIGSPEELVEGLSLTLGVRGVVEKKRLLFLKEQTRIHLDEVTGLGFYLELEVVLAEGESEEYGIQIADDLMGELGIDSSQLVSHAYIDLIENR